jgi:hypothetical protein
MPNDDLDRRLARFLNDQEENPIRDTLDRIANNQLLHEKQDSDRHTELKEVIAGHAGRLTALEQRTARLEDREDDTATRDRRTLELAARAEGIALGKERRRSDPPIGKLIARAASSGVGKAIGIIALGLALLTTGWLSRHWGVGVQKEAAAAPEKR